MPAEAVPRNYLDYQRAVGIKQLSVFYEISRYFNTAHALLPAVEFLLYKAAEVSQATQGAIFQWQQQRFYLRASLGLTEAEKARIAEVDPQQTALTQVVVQQKPVTGHTVNTRNGSDLLTVVMPQWFAVPIKARTRIIGAIVLNGDIRPSPGWNLPFLVSIGEEFGETINAFCLREKLRQQNERLRRMSLELLHAREQERSRLARDLHDQLGQDLRAIALLLDVLQNNIAADPNLGAVVRDCQEIVARATQELKRIIADLEPLPLQGKDFHTSLAQYLEGIGRQLRVKWHLEWGVPPGTTLDSTRQVVVFRITQEAITNAVNHGRATEVVVSLSGQDGYISLSISDNGGGFDPVTVRPEQPGGRGLGIMQERISLLGGRVSWESSPGKGCTVTAWIPLNGQAARQRRCVES